MNFEHPLGPVGKVYQGEGEQADDLTKTKGDNRQIVTPHAQDGDAQEDARKSSKRDSDGNHQPEAHIDIKVR